MSIEGCIDNLIEAGWRVLASDFDESDFQNWRREAFTCLTAMMGPNHSYTLYFKRYAHRYAEEALLAGEGILSAAKEELAHKVH